MWNIPNFFFPVINVGDEVEFETREQHHSYPRYNERNEDCGGSGIYAKGSVVEITDTYYVIDYTVQDFLGIGTCNFPNFDSEYYSGGQWSRPGYLRKLWTTVEIKCECGSEATYGKGTNLHSHWCKLYNK